MRTLSFPPLCNLSSKLPELSEEPNGLSILQITPDDSRAVSKQQPSRFGMPPDEPRISMLRQRALGLHCLRLLQEQGL